MFDRIREELKINPNGTLRDIINRAIHKVFARSIMTSLTDVPRGAVALSSSAAA